MVTAWHSPGRLFGQVPPLRPRDRLAQLLGAGDDDITEYRYTDGVRLRRNDTGDTVEVQYDPRTVAADPQQMPLMGAVLNGLADATRTRRFGELWQDRVRRLLLDHADDPAVVRVRRVALS